MPTTDERQSERDEDPLDPSFLRRIGAFVVDWVVSALVTFVLLPYDLLLEPGQQPPLLLGIPQSSWATLGVFFVLNVVLVRLTGSTLGHRLFGLQVWQVRAGSFTLQVLARSALACLFLPGLVRAGDGRLLHDYLAGTRIVRPGADGA
ncbi:RDD family protein [uncultured Phycicoccus sp.]|uniref:RDD family protein n=1 Tax=uncultured Phycicoccus sp. TaxID=661422 RepID=UPI002619E38F|nr:RDD family protein [uncultured Phycicoccus sp.]